MKQITEDYVSYETAVLLKEKGFDKPCYALYYPNGKWSISLFTSNNTMWENNHTDIGVISSPTQAMAMAWLREEKNIHFLLNPFFGNDSKVKYSVNVLSQDLNYSIYDNLEENSYEEAVEAACLYVLKNLL